MRIDHARPAQAAIRARAFLQSLPPWDGKSIADLDAVERVAIVAMALSPDTTPGEMRTALSVAAAFLCLDLVQAQAPLS